MNYQVVYLFVCVYLQLSSLSWSHRTVRSALCTSLRHKRKKNALNKKERNRQNSQFKHKPQNQLTPLFWIILCHLFGFVLRLYVDLLSFFPFCIYVVSLFSYFVLCY